MQCGYKKKKRKKKGKQTRDKAIAILKGKYDVERENS